MHLLISVNFDLLLTFLGERFSSYIPSHFTAILDSIFHSLTLLQLPWIEYSIPQHYFSTLGRTRSIFQLAYPRNSHSHTIHSQSTWINPALPHNIAVPFTINIKFTLGKIFFFRTILCTVTTLLHSMTISLDRPFLHHSITVTLDITFDSLATIQLPWVDSSIPSQHYIQSTPCNIMHSCP